MIKVKLTLNDGFDNVELVGLMSPPTDEGVMLQTDDGMNYLLEHGSIVKIEHIE